MGGAAVFADTWPRHFYRLLPWPGGIFCRAFSCAGLRKGLHFVPLCAAISATADGAWRYPRFALTADGAGA